VWSKTEPTEPNPVLAKWFRFARIGDERSMPKERTRERQGRKEKRSGRDNRRESRGPLREKRGDTRIDTLRQTYGDSFAPGIRGDAHLKTLLDRTGSSSLSDYLRTGGHSPVSGKVKGDRVIEKAPKIRYASNQRFEEAHRKTSTLHAGLFRRLAE
jgi:hypothetical protein